MNSAIRDAAFLLLGMAPGLVAAADLAPLGPAPAPFERAGRAIRRQDSVSRSSGVVKAGDDSGSSALAVNTQSREAVRQFFQSNYLASENVSLQWTGHFEGCDPGATAPTFRDAVRLRINYYRAMAGVPANIVFTEERNRMAQEAALMVSANNSMNRNPPATWMCYTEDGAEAISGANLYLNNCGPEAIRGYIYDFGSENSKVAHRRFLLYPQNKTLGTGDVPFTGNRLSANVSWAYDENYFGPRPATRDGFVAWPPPGFVPYQVVYPRWSFSYPQADFASAIITMRCNGSEVPFRREPLVNGYGENTMVWIPANMDQQGSYWQPWPAPAADTSYAVTIQNVLIANVRRSFTYTVTVMDTSVASPVLRVLPGNPLLQGKQVLIDFEVENCPAGASFQLEKCNQWPVQWKLDTAALFQVVVSNRRMRAVTVAGTEPLCVYRVRLN